MLAGSFDNHAYAFDAANGEVRWSRDVGAIISGAGSVIGDIYYVATLGDRTFGLDVASGEVRFERDAGAVQPRRHRRQAHLLHRLLGDHGLRSQEG